jgi:hypothetical protein
MNLQQKGERVPMSKMSHKKAMKLHGISVLVLAPILTLLVIASGSEAAVVKGRVTALLGDVIKIDIGSERGAQVGDSGRLYYTVMIEGKERPVYIADFKITQLSANTSTARVEEKGVDVRVGFLTEVTIKEGELEVRSEPSGAKVYLDGNEMGETPIVLSEVWSGKHTVRVMKDGYAPHEEQVEIKGADRKKITTSLRRLAEVPTGVRGKTGELVVQTNPSGADIFINGKPVGISPYENKASFPGTSKMRIAKEGYEPWETDVVVEIGKRLQLLAYLKAMEGNLEILSSPSGAKVFMDGKEIGETPLSVSCVPAGEHQVRILKEEYSPYEERVSVKGRERGTVRATLERLAGELLVSTEPEDAGIYIDGKPVGRSPYEGKALSSGIHKVKIMKEGYEVWDRDVVVEAGKRKEILIKLNAKRK